MNAEDNKLIKFFETLNSIPLPSWVKKNILIALSKGVGQLITAGFDWPTAWLEAKAKELRAKADGNILVQEEASNQVASLFKTDSELATRALNYYARKIIENQYNREDVANNFIFEMPNQTFKSNEEIIIDDDWLNTFWTISETKSSEDIKFILGKILAKEVSNPKSISPITLQLISVLTTDIGSAFHKLCNLSIKHGDFVFVIHPNLTPFMSYGELSNFGISFDEQAELEGIGLIRSINAVSIDFQTLDGTFDDCDYAGVKAKMNFSKGINIIDFTRAGRELRDLLDLKANEMYTEFLNNLGKDKFQIVG